MTTKYIIYKYYLQRYVGGQEERMPAEKCAGIIEELMPGKIGDGLKIVSTKTKKGEQELCEHGNRLEQHYRNMACLLVEANKTKKITQNYVDHEEVHNPYVHVLFDFNPEHCLMAVERKDSAMKVDKTVELITSAFNEQIRGGEWQFKCEQPSIPMNFWDILTFIRDRFEDRLKKVSLVFDNDKTKNDGKNKSEEEKRLKFVDELIAHFGKGGISVDCADDKQMEAYKDDIIYFAKLCAENNYQLEAEFCKFGKLYHTDIFPAIMPLDNDVLDEYLCRKAETNVHGYQIEVWFKNIQVLFDPQEEANEDERRRSRMDKV